MTEPFSLRDFCEPGDKYTDFTTGVTEIIGGTREGAITTTEGAVFEPWTDGYAVGFKVTHPERPTRYVYLNPSSETDTGDIDDSDVFVYHGETGDSSVDGAVCFVNIWDKQEVERDLLDPDEREI